jgi:integrase
MTRETENPHTAKSEGAAAPPQSRRDRGEGSIFQKRYTDKKTGKTKKTSMLYMKFYVGGKPKIEPTGTRKHAEAKKILRRKLGEIANGRYIPADVDRTTFGQIKEMLLNHYKANERRSLDRVEDAVAHLEGFFGLKHRVRDIASDRITAYMAARRQEAAANATINRELAALKLMLRLGERAGKVVNRPYIGMLEENNKRKGFFEADQCAAVLRHLPDDLRPVFEVAYITGWRVKDEILTREKCHLDLKAGWLRLEPGETKNNEGRMFPISTVPRLREVLERQLARTESFEKAKDRIIPCLFHRKGRPIKSFRRAWLTACKNAGVPGRIPHDFRRTAIRNLERAGVPRSAAMAMVGHKTESVYRRYAIIEEGMLNEAGVKLQTLYDNAKAGPASVVRFPRARARRGAKA